MKKTLLSTIKLAALVLAVCLSSCNKYLDVLPKGQKIPTTLADYEAFLRDEYGNQLMPITQAVNLLNDQYLGPFELSYYPLYAANYNWDESANRIALNKSDEDTYYAGYQAISTANLIIQKAGGATEASDAAKATLIAQAKILRTLNYFVQANYYADNYDEATAATKLSVPLILNADIDAPYTQVSIKDLYTFMLKDIAEAIPNLPAHGATILHGNLGTAYALQARIYLQMGQYTQALTAANNALVQNNQLFDWTTFYGTYKAQIEDPGTYANLPSPMGYDYVENYNFRHGSHSYFSGEVKIRTDRATRFEQGDAKFLSRWKLQTVGTDSYYTSITSGYYNYGGLTTAEVYLIKAECLARQDDVHGAMDNLNAVRVKRILNYSPLTANTKNEALNLILRTKANELILTIVPFADARRLNKDSNYDYNYSNNETGIFLKKIENGNILKLSKNSHLWTMPFPQGAVKNSGNGTIKQNVEK